MWGACTWPVLPLLPASLCWSQPSPTPTATAPPRPAPPADLREVCLDLGPGAPPLRFAAAYGFRNIQGLMRKVKLGRCEYDYVEVMACPSGGWVGGWVPRYCLLPHGTAAGLQQQWLVLLLGIASNASCHAVGGSQTASSSILPEH